MVRINLYLLVAKFNGHPVLVIGQEKGEDLNLELKEILE